MHGPGGLRRHSVGGLFMTLTNGLRVPAWAIGAILAVAAIFGLGIGYGSAASDNSRKIERLEEQNKGLDFRLCRIERALAISPYQTCGQ